MAGSAARPQVEGIMSGRPVQGVPTPALVVDTAVLDQNIATAHRFLTEAGVRVRPHVKTHKSLEIARRQLAAGASGLTVATIGEAEVFAQVSDDLFIAYPLWPDAAQFAVLNALASRIRLAIGADSIEGITHLAEALDPAVELMIEIDSGHHRTGCAPNDSGALAAAAGRLGLRIRGVFTFPGHSYGPGTTTSAAADESAALTAAAASIRTATGQEELELSGGSTPSHRSTAAGIITEARPGVYVFNDAQQWELGTADPRAISLTAYARVVSARPGHFVLDAGSKVLGSDRAPYASGHGRLLDLPEARIIQLSEHHAVVASEAPVQIGDTVRVVPNHVCSAVNLVSELVPVVGAHIHSPWPVDARGRNR